MSGISVSMIYVNEYFFFFLCPVSIAGGQFAIALRSYKATKSSHIKNEVLIQYPFPRKCRS